jgi:hypothetical protein
MTPNRRLFALANRCFGLATLAPLRRCHQRTVFTVRGDKIAGSDFEQPQVARRVAHRDVHHEIHRLEDDVHGHSA